MSLRDTITAAIEEHAPAPDPVEAAAPAPAPGGEASVQPPPEAPAVPESGQPRAPDGKFAAKAAELPAAANDPAAPPLAAEPPQAEESIRVPQALPAPLKAKFKELPPEWREALLKREDDVNSMRDQWAPKGERLNRLEQLLHPHKDRITLAGVDDVTYIGRLFAAEQVLQNDGVGGIVQLMEMYGVDPGALLARLTGQQGAPQGGAGYQPDPRYQALQGEVQTLKSTLQQQQQAAEEREGQAIQAEVNAFAADPANLYFENVRPQVATLLRSGEATNLKEAYEKALWLNPETRAILQQEAVAKASQPSPEAAARAKAEAAARAAGSVTGAPAAGAVSGADPKNLRETIRAAVNEHAGRV